MKKLIGLVSLVCLVGSLSGCTVTRITADGWKLERISFFQHPEIQRVRMPDGSELDGYKNGQDVAEVAAKITEAAMKGLKP